MSEVLKGKAKIMVNGNVIGEAIDAVVIRKVDPESIVELPPTEFVPLEANFTVNLSVESAKVWQENLKKLFGDPMDLINEPKRIFFWAQKDQYGAFSNFYRAPFMLDSREWPTIEHYFQAMKTDNVQKQEEVRAAKTPGEAKRMGRKLELRSNWDQIRYDIMRVAVLHKFVAHKAIRDLLLSTGEAEIYEDSPFDKIWGTGVKGGVGDGQNLLGKVLMETRDTLRRFPVG